MIRALNQIEVITLFVDDLGPTKDFYRNVFGLEVVYEDEHSAVVRLENLMVNLLQSAQAPEVIEPVRVAPDGDGARALFTIAVADVDAVCAELRDHGVRLLNGPVDRPWGRRTAAFADPAGHLWEIAHELG